MKGRLLFLGTGGSMGVPIIGCQCPVCQSDSPFNKRLRPSVLIYIQGKVFLIDVGPDFRQQALRSNIHHLDGILLTHAHNDHIAGLDDLRPIYFNKQQPLPILLSQTTSDEIQARYSYIFKKGHPYEKYAAQMDLHILPSTEGEIDFQGVSVQYVTYEQGGMPINGFRFGHLAYLTDMRHFQRSIFEQLKGIKILIINALKFTPSPMHFSVDEAIEFASKTDAEEVWLTHISHELDHEKTNIYLPSHIRLAYDGLEITFD